MFKKIDYKKLDKFNYGLYQGVYLPNHPDADNRGNVYLHRLIAEQEILHRSIKKTEAVHHIDGNKFNNSPNNLLVFKTKNDHSAYHAGGTLSLDGDVYISTRKIYYCMMCGSEVSNGNNLCRKCSMKINKERYPLENIGHPTKEELQNLLSYMTYSAIGRQYGVNGNTIKKRAIKYGIYEKVFKDIPSDFNTNEYLKNHTLTEVAKYYGVSKDIVVTWAKNTKVPIMKKYIHCIDTDELFSSGREVVRHYFPEDQNPKLKAEKISKAIKNNSPLWDKYWEYSYVPTYY